MCTQIYSIDVQYVRSEERLAAENHALVRGEDFYNLAQFKLLTIVDETATEDDPDVGREAIKIMFCKTCKILRPPRSFHCSVCNACIEV